jgi:hypothetical protein
VSDDHASRISVLEERVSNSGDHIKEVEARVNRNVEKSEGRIIARIEKLEGNSKWLVLIVLGAVIGKVLQTIGFK